MRCRWMLALCLLPLLAATAAVVASVPLHRIPRLVWARDSATGIAGWPHVAPDTTPLPGPSCTSSEGDLTGFTVLPFPNRIIRTIGLRLIDTTVDEDDWLLCEPTGREVRRPSGRWREYRATPSW